MMFRTLLLIVLVSNLVMLNAQNDVKIYLNSSTGNDGNIGSEEEPLKSLAAAADLVNNATGNGPVTIVLAPGIYAIDRTAVFNAANRSFTKENRLKIVAEILPGDTAWNTGSMPTLIHTMPLSDMWMGRKDPFGGVSYGMMIETSHVTIQGLKILGIPVIEHPVEGYIQRVYPIGRMNPDLDDLEITQCLFAGDEVTNPNHLPILANGNYVWISQTSRDPGQQEVTGEEQSDPILYHVKNSLFAGNKNYVGTGGGPALNFRDIEPSVLKLDNTKQSDQEIELEMDQSKRNYLHPKENTLGADMGVGLFKKK